MYLSCENVVISLRSIGQDENGFTDRFTNNFTILHSVIDLLIVYLLACSMGDLPWNSRICVPVPLLNTGLDPNC
jgi:hypothetical protein